MTPDAEPRRVRKLPLNRHQIDKLESKSAASPAPRGISSPYPQPLVVERRAGRNGQALTASVKLLAGALTLTDSMHAGAKAQRSSRVLTR
jgi:hypothetical protein